MEWKNGRRNGHIEDRRTVEMTVNDSYFGSLTGSFNKRGVIMAVTPTTLNKECQNAAFQAYIDSRPGQAPAKSIDLAGEFKKVLMPNSCEAKLDRFLEQAATMGLQPETEFSLRNFSVTIKAARPIAP